MGPNECVDESPEPIGDTEIGTLGVSVAEVLAFADEQRFSLVRTGEGASPLEAVMTVRATPGGAEFIPTRQLRPLIDPDPCLGRIERDVEVDLSLNMPAGDLQLKAAGRLQADSRYRARLTARFSEQAGGALQTLQLGAEESLRHLELRALLTPAGSSGQLTAVIERVVRVGPQPEPKGDAPRARDYTSERHAQVAFWPAESDCADGELPLARDRSLFDRTPEQVVQSFTEPRTLRWDDGSTTILTLTAASIGTTCLADLNPEWFSPIDWPPLDPEDPALFGVPFELSAATEDRRFQSRFSTVLQYRAKKSGGVEQVWIEHEAKLEPGDAGGWTTNAADLSTARRTVLQLGTKHSNSHGMLLLLGPPRAEEPCKEAMCVGLPPRSPTLLGGRIE